MRMRRPLLRAAAVGGGAFIAGKKMAQHAAGAGQSEGAAPAAAAGTGGANGTGGAAAAGAAGGGPVADQLQQISALHQQGALTDAEFTAAKAKLLGT